MEAYMLAQEKAQEKLHEASDKQNEMQKRFAAKYDVKLINEETELDIKSKQAAGLMKHYDEVYLIFFKPYKQEAYLMEATGKKNIIAIEQNKNALQKFADEGLQKLKTLNYFYKSEAARMQLATDFFMKEENFNKLKKNFESKPASKRTQVEVDEYNKGVNEINATVNEYNSANKELNKQRETALDLWNSTVKKYLDNYMPVQRKQ
jgi:hypothetical protein